MMKRTARVLLVAGIMGVGVSLAAWPDIYPSRVAAMEALRTDLIMPELRRDEARVAAQYAAACRKGFGVACQVEAWSGNLAAAAEQLRRQCSYEPLACVVVGWSMSRVDGQLSPYATDAAGAARMFKKACKTDLYAPACTSLGELYLAGVGVTADSLAAQALFEEGCAARDHWGCYQLGGLYLQEGKTAQAAVQLKRSCDNQIVQGCASLGILLEEGEGIERDLPAAAALFRDGCEAGVTESCYRLGELYASGRGVPPSGATALGLYRVSCEAGELRGCYGEGVLFAEGNGIPQNIEAAISRFDSSCEAGYAQGCSQLGRVYFRGQGMRKDVRLGMRYLRRGCNAGDPLGCEELGAALVRGGRDIERDPEEAIRVLHHACEGGSGRACGLMASLYEDGTLPPGDRSPRELHTLACGRDHGESCRWLAERSPDEASAWYQQGCAADDGASCGALGQAALAGGERESARGWLRAACQLNDLASCTPAGAMYEEDADLIEALALYERGCEQGREEACVAAAPITFEARYNEILRSAFSSSVCQLWRIDPENPTDSELLVEADGPRFLVRSGVRSGSEATAWHIDERIEQGTTWAGRSRWSIGGGDATENAWLQPVEEAAAVWPPQPPAPKPSASAWQRQDRYWETAVELYETWDSRLSVDTFPGEHSYAIDQDGENTISYSREDGSVRRLQEGRCQFLDSAVLQTENCSEIQALLAATLLTTCP
jgi:TPR repeat protein